MANCSFTSHVKAESNLWCKVSLTVTERSYDTATNTSVVAYSFSGSQRNDGVWKFSGTTRNPAGKVVVNINGSDVKSAGIALINMNQGVGTCSGSGTVAVAHNNDGKKTINFSIRMNEVTGNYSGDPWKYGSASASGLLKLTDIPRASDFTINAGNAQLGSPVSVKITPKVSNFSHTVEYSFADSGWTKVTAAVSDEGITASITPPLSLANQIPDTTTGVLSVRVTTVNGGTTIGSPVVKTVNLNLPTSVVPTMGTPTATIVNGSVPSSWGVYVKGYSKATIKINSTAGVYGSTIKSYSISGPGLTSSSATGTTDFLQTVGNNTYVCTITDSRGRTATKTITIAVQDYTPPSIAISAQRCNSAGAIAANGTYLKVTVDWTIASVASKNSVASRSVTCNGVSNTTFSDSTAFILAANVSIGTTYVLTARLKDGLGNSDTKTVSIPTAERIMNIRANKKGLAIGKFSEKDGFEVDWNSYFNKPVDVNGDSTFRKGVSFIGSSFSISKAIQQILGKLFNPVGTIVINTTGVNPGTYLGGTWEAFAPGRTLVGVGTGNDGSTSMTFTPLSTQGEYKHTLTESEMPSHRHYPPIAVVYNGNAGISRSLFATNSTFWSKGDSNNATTSTGGSLGHNNTQPSISVYIWRRTA